MLTHVYLQGRAGLALLSLVMSLLACGRSGQVGDTFDNPGDAAVNNSGARMDAGAAPHPAYRVLFLRQPPGSTAQQIFEMAVNGTQERQLTNRQPISAFTWLPEHQKIAFVGWRAPEPGFDLYSMQRDGTGVERLKSWGQVTGQLQDGSDFGALTWAPHGNLGFHAIDLWTRSVFLLPISETGPPTKIVDPGEYPAWSPEGQRMVVSTHRGLVIAANDGANPVLIVPRELDNERWSRPVHARWSPTDDLIVFAAGGSELDLFTVRPDGTDRKRITNLGGSEQHPTFSPDGQKIAFEHWVGHNSNVLMIDLRSNEITLLVENANYPRFVP